MTTPAIIGIDLASTETRDEASTLTGPFALARSLLLVGAS